MEPFARIPGDGESAEDRNAIDAAIGIRRRANRTANLGPFTGYRIGLDIGNGNIGWCILFEQDKIARFLSAEDIAALNRTLPPDARRIQLPDLSEFVPIGVHKFSNREPKTQVSWTKKRAKYRIRMRTLDTRQYRKRLQRRSLVDAGLLPADPAKIQGHASIKSDQLRVVLLDPNFPAHPHDLGRALYNLLQRRGYMPPRGRVTESEETGFGKRVEKDYRESLSRFGCRTLGEFLSRCAADAKKDGISPFRKKHRTLKWQKEHSKEKPKNPDRAKSYEVLQFLTPSFGLVWDEAERLRDSQKHRAPVADSAWDSIRDAANWRRDIASKQPGWCRYLPDEFRCVRALPSFQDFRVLHQVANLRDLCGRELDREEFDAAAKVLRAEDKLTLKRLAEKIGIAGLKADRNQKPEDKAIARDLRGATTDIILGQRFGKKWLGLPIAVRDDWVMRFLRRHWPRADEARPWRTEDETQLHTDAVAAFGPDAMEHVAEFLKDSREDKFADISAKAARILADAYGARLTYKQRQDRLREAGMKPPELALYDELPYYGAIMRDQTVPAAVFAPPERTAPNEWQHGRTPNPDVHIVLNRVRKVVNAIVGMMGGLLPTRCIVEVARAALSEEAASDHNKRALARKNLHDRIVREIAKVHPDVQSGKVFGPSLDRLVDRWKAAIRQGWRDYDGSRIAPSQLVDGHEYQLDHVSPRAFGEFRENNMFVSRFNRTKGAQLPWPAFGGKAEFREALLAFAGFGLQQRISALNATLKSKERMPEWRKENLKKFRDETVAELERVHRLGTPRRDVLQSLRDTISNQIDVAGDGNPAGQEELGRRTEVFRRKDQISLFCRFAPEAKPPQSEYAARDTANIGWSTKLTLRYLKHLGAFSGAIKPWCVHALRCMYGINKDRSDNRNHAVDAFLIAHLDDRVMRPMLDALVRDQKRGYFRFEELYSPHKLRRVAPGIGSGEEFLRALEANLDRLDQMIGTIATAHRPDHGWNPGDPGGGSLGTIGGENTYGFKPTRQEREALTAIAIKGGLAEKSRQTLSRKELLALLSSEPVEKGRSVIVGRMRDLAKLKYVSRDGEENKVNRLKWDTATSISAQPNAFIDKEGKFAIGGPHQGAKREVVSTVEFSRGDFSLRRKLFSMKRIIYRSGDTILESGGAFVISGLKADYRVVAYAVDKATTDEQRQITVPSDVEAPSLVKFASDVLGRRLHRLRKSSGGLEPVPYSLRERRIGGGGQG